MNTARIAHTLAALSTLSLALGCAPIDDVSRSVEALTGPAPVGPASLPNTLSTGNNIWSSGAGGNQWWAPLHLGDIDGNGLDDLCGDYGNSFGCALNFGIGFNTWIEVQDVRSFQESTVRLADFNGDGRTDVCYRDSLGYRCQYSQRVNNVNTITFPLTAAGRPFFQVPDMSNANGWNRPEYESTVMLGRLEGNGGGLDLCARGIGGVMCHFNAGNNTMTRGPLIANFSDANGWNRPEYYSTLAMVDVNNDQRMDICGRGNAGIFCAIYDHTTRTFRAPTLWTSQFSDARGWSDPRYYTSIRFGDVNADGRADVCGRGRDGVYCGLGNGVTERFDSAESVVISRFSDAQGFAAGALPSTMTLVDFNNDGRKDVCMVSPAGEIECARARIGTPIFEAAVRRTVGAFYFDGLVAGKLRASSRGMCWFDIATSDVRCSNTW